MARTDTIASTSQYDRCLDIAIGTAETGLRHKDNPSVTGEDEDLHLAMSVWTYLEKRERRLEGIEPL